MKYIYIIVACAMIFASCGRGAKTDGAAAQAAHVHGESCSHGSEEAAHTHDHEGDSGDHTGHDHSAGCSHDHSGHDHSTHDHSTHDHSGHDHSGHDHSGHDHSGHDHGSENPDEIVFPAAQAARTDFEVQTVRRGDFTDVIRTGGRILPAQGDEVAVVAPMSGVVSFAGARLSDGSPVSRGQMLFSISARNIASGDPVARNRAAYEKARSDFERAEKLLADRIVSQKEYDEARLAYEQARIEHEALGGSRASGGAGVSASIAGYVGGLTVNEGDYVETGTLLANITQNRKLVLRAEVSQRYLQRLRNVSGANFTVPYDDATYSLSEMGGRLLSVSRNASSGSALLPVTFEFDNTAAVTPGTYVEVSLLGAPMHDVISLPLTAVTEQQGLHYVYVQLDEECYMKREVALGPDDGVRVRILSGLEPGERVVTRGAVNVKMASASGSIPHTHEH